MDYTAILKKSWNITWRYKILWLFGFFAGAGGGINYSGNGMNNRTGSGSDLPGGMSQSQLAEFASRYLVLIIVVVLFLIVLGLLMLMVSVAARGGIVHLVNEAEEGREVRAGAGWHAGFSKWWRLFGVGFVAEAPIALLILVMLVVLGVVGLGAWASSGGSSDAIGAAFAAAGLGLCCFGFVFIAAMAFLGVVLGIVKELAIRYVMLEDRGVMDALKTAWRDLWAKRGAFLMFLIQVGVGMAYGIVTGIVAVVLVVPAVLLIALGNVVGGSMMILFAILLLIVPSAVYATFFHAAWTLFFRRMTGRELLAAAAVPVVGYPPVPPAPFEPPAPVAEPLPAPAVEPASPVESEPDSGADA